VAVRQARLAIAAVFAIHGAVAGTFATRIPWIKDHLHLSAGQLGLALVMPGLGALVTLPFGGRIDHHLGSRRATSVLLPLWCAWLILPSLAPNLPLLCVACFGLGATSVLCDVPMNAQGVAVEARLGRSIMSRLHGLWSCGGLLASAVGALAAHAAVDARVHFALASAALLAAGLVACRWLLDTPPDEEAEPPPAWALPERAVLVIGLAAFCAIFVEAASSDWAAVYLRDVTGAAAGTAIIGYTGYALAMTVGRLAGDSVVGALGPVRTVRTGGLLAIAGSVLLVAGGSVATGIAGFTLLGLGVAVAVPLAFAAAGHRSTQPSRAIAGVATIAYGAGLVAPGVIGGVAQLTSLQGSFVIVGLLALLIVVAAPAMR
jgi:predicted MFS family arabinose efflux permease